MADDEVDAVGGFFYARDSAVGVANNDVAQDTLFNGAGGAVVVLHENAIPKQRIPNCHQFHCRTDCKIKIPLKYFNSYGVF